MGVLVSLSVEFIKEVEGYLLAAVFCSLTRLLLCIKSLWAVLTVFQTKFPINHVTKKKINSQKRGSKKINKQNLQRKMKGKKGQSGKSNHHVPCHVSCRDSVVLSAAQWWGTSGQHLTFSPQYSRVYLPPLPTSHHQANTLHHHDAEALRLFSVLALLAVISLCLADESQVSANTSLCPPSLALFFCSCSNLKLTY